MDSAAYKGLVRLEYKVKAPLITKAYYLIIEPLDWDLRPGSTSPWTEVKVKL